MVKIRRRFCLKYVEAISVLLVYGANLHNPLPCERATFKLRPNFQFDVKSNIKLKFQAKLVTFWKVHEWNKYFELCAIISFGIDLCLEKIERATNILETFQLLSMLVSFFLPLWEKTLIINPIQIHILVHGL